MAHWSLWKNLLKSSSNFFVQKKNSGNFFTSPISVQLSQYFHCSLSQINLFIYIIMIKIYFEAKLSEWKHPQYLAQMILKIIFMNYWKNVGSKIVWRKRIKIEIIFNFARFLIADFFPNFSCQISNLAQKMILIYNSKKATLRAQILRAAKSDGFVSERCDQNFSIDEKIAIGLISEFLQRKNMDLTLSVFLPACG